MRWKVNVPRIIFASLPSFCQKLSKMAETWRSSDKNNFAPFFERRCTLTFVDYLMLLHIGRNVVCTQGFRWAFWIGRTYTPGGLFFGVWYAGGIDFRRFRTPSLQIFGAIFTRTWLRYVRVFAIAIPSVVCRLSVCRLSVCNVGAPYSEGWTFRQNFFTAVYASHPLTPYKILRR